jgi:2-octaprenyl-3-methyl-6-methoxy-1,4-benzoquinol hydroxylase/2-octaprenylphenol hydroxylase
MSGGNVICVVGGGLNGAAAALALADAGWPVVLVDRHKPTPSPSGLGVEIRNVALSPASRAFLEGIDGWVDGAPYHRMHVWEALGTASLDFHAHESGRAELGWVVEVGALTERLWSRIEQHSRVRVLLASVDGVDTTGSLVTLRTDVEAVPCALLVAADGAGSPVRNLTGMRDARYPTGHAALVTAVRTERPHGGVAYQRFLPDGPLALLPSRLPDVSSVVWSQPPALASARVEAPQEAFLRDMTSATEGVLGNVLEADARFAFPLVQHLARSFVAAPRVLLIGDAARVVHPLAGLGVNLGFEDAQALLAALPPSGDPGLADWRTFARKRQARSQAMLRLMSALRLVYGSGSPWLGWARNMGVRAVSGSRLLKSQIMREAMGLGPMATSMR